jgi:hypothetical protein
MHSSQNPCVELPLVVGLVGQQRDELRVQDIAEGSGRAAGVRLRRLGVECGLGSIEGVSLCFGFGVGGMLLGRL